MLHPSLEGVRTVKLSQTKSAFWRFHTKGVSDDGVCTIEAMFFFLEGLRPRLEDPRFTRPHPFDNLVGAGGRGVGGGRGGRSAWEGEEGAEGGGGPHGSGGRMSGSYCCSFS